MTHDENQAIQKFGDEVISQLKQLALKNPIDSTGILISTAVLTANLCRVQTEAIVESMRKATILMDAENIVRFERIE